MAILLEMTLTGGALILLVLLLRAMFLNRLPKTAFIVMWAIVLFRLFLPVSFFGTAEVAVSESSEVSSVEAVTPTEELEVSQVITLNSYDSTKESEAVAETADKTNIFGIIWLVGAVLCGIVLVISYVLSFRRFSLSESLESEFIASFQSSSKLRRTVTIKLSDKTTTPFTYGIIHPVILLPMGMDLSDEKQLKYVLMHEYIHIRKLDNLLKGISSVAVCIHWFNPLVWVMNKFLSRDIELRCDETLLKNCEGDCRAEYALTLIDLEDRRRSLAVGTAFAKEPAEERVRAIMKYRKATPSSAVAMILCITMLCMAFVGCGAVRTAGVKTEAIAESEEELSAVSVASAIAEAVADSGVISEATGTGTVTISVNDLISANAKDCNFDCIAYDCTLPDGMYFDGGILYNADGEAEGKLKAGDEYMVIDGTGDAAEGYMFVIIDLDVYGVKSLDSGEDYAESAVERQYLQSENTENYSLNSSALTKCYPIYESISQTESDSSATTYNLTSYRDASTVSVEVTYGEFTYTYAYTSSGTLSLGVRLIYIVPKNETNIVLYFG